MWKRRWCRESEPDGQYRNTEVFPTLRERSNPHFFNSAFDVRRSAFGVFFRYSFQAVSPPTIVRTALPFSFQPSKGVLRDND